MTYYFYFLYFLIWVGVVKETILIPKNVICVRFNERNIFLKITCYPINYVEFSEKCQRLLTLLHFLKRKNGIFFSFYSKINKYSLKTIKKYSKYF